VFAIFDVGHGIPVVVTANDRKIDAKRNKCRRVGLERTNVNGEVPGLHLCGACASGEGKGT
jgi:hypothetical protein